MLWEVGIVSHRYPETLGHAVLGGGEFIQQGRGEGGTSTVQGTRAKDDL